MSNGLTESSPVVTFWVLWPQWKHRAKKSLLLQNDIATSFWRNNDVIIAPRVRWDPVYSMIFSWFNTLMSGDAYTCMSRWRHQMETFSALLAICAGKSPVPGEFPTQRPVTRSFDVFFDRRPNKRLSKQTWGWWFETLSCSLWRHCNASVNFLFFFRVTICRLFGEKPLHESMLTLCKTRHSLVLAWWFQNFQWGVKHGLLLAVLP